MKSRVAIIILAAGSSSRLGQPKQLLLKDGETLIRRIVGMAIGLQQEWVLVITGAYAEELQRSLVGMDLTVVYNADWQEGMASSIRAGIHTLDGKGYDGALLLACDQVAVHSSLLEKIISSYRAGQSSIVCCGYDLQPGIPALFDSVHFPELLLLRGDRGAKSLIQACENKTIIEFEKGALDIDEPDDLPMLG
jgi:molybdenum cofactor cytidylyltransferase